MPCDPSSGTRAVILRASLVRRPLTQDRRHSGASRLPPPPLTTQRPGSVSNSGRAGGLNVGRRLKAAELRQSVASQESGRLFRSICRARSARYDSFLVTAFHRTRTTLGSPTDLFYPVSLPERFTSLSHRPISNIPRIVKLWESPRQNRGFPVHLKY